MAAHFDLPFTLGPDGSFRTVEQDSSEDITACVTAILLSRVGFRDDRPEVGIPDPVHRQGGLNLEMALSIVTTFEPRVDRILERNPAALQTIIDRVTVKRPDE